jgi:hypothetical protein
LDAVTSTAGDVLAPLLVAMCMTTSLCLGNHSAMTGKSAPSQLWADIWLLLMLSTCPVASEGLSLTFAPGWLRLPCT